MTKERELLHRAYAHIGHALPEKLQKEIKAALAQPEPEPVTWRKINGNDYVYCDDMTDFPTHEDFGWQPLYTHPQPERPPLTEDEINEHGTSDYCMTYTRPLFASPRPMQRLTDDELTIIGLEFLHEKDDLSSLEQKIMDALIEKNNGVNLYDHPHQEKKPLTKDELISWHDENGRDQSNVGLAEFISGARFAEMRHGIKESECK
jgi:hypothetical protein